MYRGDVFYLVNIEWPLAQGPILCSYSQILRLRSPFSDHQVQNVCASCVSEFVCLVMWSAHTHTHTQQTLPANLWNTLDVNTLDVNTDRQNKRLVSLPAVLVIRKVTQQRTSIEIHIAVLQSFSYLSFTVPGIIGCFQALEAVKIAAGIEGLVFITFETKSFSNFSSILGWIERQIYQSGVWTNNPQTNVSALHHLSSLTLCWRSPYFDNIFVRDDLPIESM